MARLKKEEAARRLEFMTQLIAQDPTQSAADYNKVFKDNFKSEMRNKAIYDIKKAMGFSSAGHPLKNGPKTALKAPPMPPILQHLQTAPEGPKRGRGRPPGSKNKTAPASNGAPPMQFRQAPAPQMMANRNPGETLEAIYPIAIRVHEGEPAVEFGARVVETLQARGVSNLSVVERTANLLVLEPAQ